MQSRNIEIRRNLVENYLMKVKDYVKSNLRQFAYAGIALLVIVVITIAGIVYFEKRATRELVQFELIMEEYGKASLNKPGDVGALVDETVKKLISVVDKSYWGYVHKNGYYIIGSICFDAGKYKEAAQYYKKYAKKSSGAFFSPLALQQAARAKELLGEYKEALVIYKELEEKYNESLVADQIFYDLGRLYEIENDIFKAREYYTKVVDLFPRSSYSKRAKEKLLLLGLKEQQG